MQAVPQNLINEMEQDRAEHGTDWRPFMNNLSLPGSPDSYEGYNGLAVKTERARMLDVANKALLAVQEIDAL